MFMFFLIFPLPIHAAHKINGLDYRNSLDPVIVADQLGLSLDTSFNGIHVYVHICNDAFYLVIIWNQYYHEDNLCCTYTFENKRYIYI